MLFVERHWSRVADRRPTEPVRIRCLPKVIYVSIDPRKASLVIIGTVLVPVKAFQGGCTEIRGGMVAVLLSFGCNGPRTSLKFFASTFWSGNHAAGRPKMR